MTDFFDNIEDRLNEAEKDAEAHANACLWTPEKGETLQAILLSAERVWNDKYNQPAWRVLAKDVKGGSTVTDEDEPRFTEKGEVIMIYTLRSALDRFFTEEAPKPGGPFAIKYGGQIELDGGRHFHRYTGEVPEDGSDHEYYRTKVKEFVAKKKQAQQGSTNPDDEDWF
jgi:hypothetical protein